MDPNKARSRIENMTKGDSITIVVETRTKQIVPREWPAKKAKQKLSLGLAPLLDVPEDKAEEGKLRFHIERGSLGDYTVSVQGKGFIPFNNTPWTQTWLNSWKGLSTEQFQSSQGVIDHVHHQIAKVETTTLLYTPESSPMHDWAEEEDDGSVEDAVWST